MLTVKAYVSSYHYSIYTFIDIFPDGFVSLLTEKDVMFSLLYRENNNMETITTITDAKILFFFPKCTELFVAHWVLNLPVVNYNKLLRVW